MKANASKRPTILVADDEEVIRRLLKYNLEKAGMTPLLAADGKEALAMMKEGVVTALVDLKMPHAGGIDVLRALRVSHPNVPVIIMSAVGQVKEAVAAMKEGAFEYITKPFDLDELFGLLEQAVKLGRTTRENSQLRQVVGQSPPQSDFIGNSAASHRILKQVATIAPLPSTILITGESGCGKGLLARRIHYSSPRAAAPFVSVSCPSLPKDLLESELFGHEKGAFTDAQQQRIGRAELADGGTLFLDEIADLPLALQPKLLTFLQERVFHRVGGSETIEVDVRVIAATNVDLLEKVRRKEFREDLYFRLNVLPLQVPPLRERKEDIPSLVNQILLRIANQRHTQPNTVSEEAMELLVNYRWPGNVRELENILERASAFCETSLIGPQDLADELHARGAAIPASDSGQVPNSQQLPALPLEELTNLAISQMLDRCGGNKAEAARRLGITEKTIYNKLGRIAKE